MIVKFMEKQDKDFVMSIDKHVNDIGYCHRVFTKTGYVMWENDVPIGMLHYSILWDNHMRKQGYKMVLISTQADEKAQHLYRKLGYIDCGGLVFHHTPFDQPMELFFRKVL